MNDKDFGKKRARVDWTSVYNLWIGLTCGVLSVVGGYGCGVLSKVTPADRAQAYLKVARSVDSACKAYEFDRATGLTHDVPAMSSVCSTVPAVEGGAGGAP